MGKNPKRKVLRRESGGGEMVEGRAGQGADGRWGEGIAGGRGMVGVGAERVGFPRKHGCKLCSESRDVYVFLSSRTKVRSQRMKTKAKT